MCCCCCARGADLTPSLRDPLDRYYTPHNAVRALLDHIGPLEPMRVLEPCAGGGAIAHVLREDGHDVMTVDVDPGAPVLCHGDALRMQWAAGGYDAVITNPPFLCNGRHAADWVRTFNPVGASFSAYLLRLSFIEPCFKGLSARTDLVIDRPPSDVLVLPRISFTGDGKTDSVTCAWFIWRKAHVGPARLVVRGR